MSTKTNTAGSLQSAEPFEVRQRILSVLRRYGVAIASVIVAFTVRFWLTPVLGEELPFMFFIAAALVAAWYGGAGTGIAALLLGLFLADYFFVRAHHTVNITDSLTVFHVVRYLFTASLGIALIEVLHRGKRRTERTLNELQQEIARRQLSEQALLKAQQTLRGYAGELDRKVNERTVSLRATVASLEEILYNIAHYLRAPLRAMGGFSRLLLESSAQKLDASGREYLGIISDAAQRMDMLTHDLLEYGRLAHIEIALTDVRTEEVLDAAMARLGPRAVSVNAEVAVDRPLRNLRADSRILQQILLELLDNGVKFSKQGVKPKIHIWTEVCQSSMRLWIEDNGIGIEPRYQQRIFGVFERLHPKTGGTGIGLAIVKQGMERQGGSVGIESEPGGGSRFWLDFPNNVALRD